MKGMKTTNTYCWLSMAAFTFLGSIPHCTTDSAQAVQHRSLLILQTLTLFHLETFIQ